MRCTEYSDSTNSSYLRRVLTTALATVALLTGAACNDSDPVEDPTSGIIIEPPVSRALTVLGHGAVAERFTSEVWARGTTAYTTTWGTRGTTLGNAIKIWDVSAAQPRLADSVIVALAGTLGDVQVSDDGSLLVAAIEPRPNGGIAIYSLADPRKPQLVTRYSPLSLQNGVHTAEIARVGGKLYAFCAIDPGNLEPARLVIVDLSVPSAPVEVSSLTIGVPYIHDVFVRDGMLFTAEWNDGVGIYDIGATRGSVSAPLFVGRARTLGGQVHNLWWFHDPTGLKRYLFVGQEGPGAIGSTSIGDIHVVDVSNFAAPVEVAMYTVPGAGVHNLSMNEASGILYAAYYNAGVKVLDVRGSLSTCAAEEKTSGLCDLGKMGRLIGFVNTSTNGLAYVWGVHFQTDALYASDMLTGLWKFSTR